MDWEQFKQTLCDDLRPNALDAMNPYVPINTVMPMIEFQAAEIDRLKAELELRDKVIEQATKHFILRGTRVYARGGEEDVFIGSGKIDIPDLYAHLAGRGE